VLAAAALALARQRLAAGRVRRITRQSKSVGEVVAVAAVDDGARSEWEFPRG